MKKNLFFFKKQFIGILLKSEEVVLKKVNEEYTWKKGFENKLSCH